MASLSLGFQERNPSLLPAVGARGSSGCAARRRWHREGLSCLPPLQPSFPLKLPVLGLSRQQVWSRSSPAVIVAWPQWPPSYGPQDGQTTSLPLSPISPAEQGRHMGWRTECQPCPPPVSKLAAAFVWQPWTPDQALSRPPCSRLAAQLCSPFPFLSAGPAGPGLQPLLCSRPRLKLISSSY